MTQNAQGNSIGGVSNFQISGSPEVYSQLYNLVPGTALELDFKPLVNQRKVSRIQGVFIDNTDGAAEVVLTVTATLQRLSCPIGFQMIMPLYMTADMVVTVSGDGLIPIIFNNFPTPAAVWSAT